MLQGRLLKKGLSLAEELRCSDVSPLSNPLNSKPDRQIGVEIVKRSLEEPIRQIVNNAGIEGSVVVEK